jgi:hypothetical protein
VAISVLLAKKIALRLFDRRTNVRVSGRESFRRAWSRTRQCDNVRRTMH